METEEGPERVPNVAPYGSITDGEWICLRCRESITGCMLCAGEIRAVGRARQEWRTK